MKEFERDKDHSCVAREKLLAPSFLEGLSPVGTILGESPVSGRNAVE